MQQNKNKNGILLRQNQLVYRQYIEYIKYIEKNINYFKNNELCGNKTESQELR